MAEPSTFDQIVQMVGYTGLFMVAIAFIAFIVSTLCRLAVLREDLENIDEKLERELENLRSTRGRR